MADREGLKQEKKNFKTKQITKEGKEKQNEKGTKVKDNRFKSAQYDPRFVTPSSNIEKIKIDKRFADKMEGENFQMSGSVDKYGRRQKKNEQLGGMGDYYYSQDQNEKRQKTKESKRKPIEKAQAIEEEDPELSEEENPENNISKWMKEYDEQSSSQMEEDVDELVQDSDSVWSQDKENVIKNDKVEITKRLALCNYDWMNINAKDLMLLFSSFKPTAGTILSVTVYYSQIGKEKMQLEQKFGPQGIWNTNVEDSKAKSEEKSFKQTAKAKKLEDQAFNHKKLRAYEKERLKYCYAIIECNSKKTSDQIYRECDGNQFQNSNILFDLRFVPDDVKFDPSMLKEKCDQIPASGEVKNFVSRAMGHSNVALTWEDPQLNGVASLKKKNWGKISDKEMDGIDWSLYIDEEGEKANDNYNKLMNANKKELEPQNDQQLNVSDWRRQCNKKYKRPQEEDELQITFPSGFDNKLPEKTQKESLNKQMKTRKERWNRIKEEKKRNQQLELLVQKSDKKEFKYNPNDERFKAVLENPSYHLDPSNPKFDHRKVGAVFQEVVKQNKKKNLL